MQSEEIIATVFLGAMFSGVFVIYLAIKQRSQWLEMQHRERLAMIERGQIPLAEPQGRGRSAARSLSLGIIVVGLGVGLAVLISLAAGSPETGIGIGGSVACLGAAFIIKSLVVRPDAPSDPS